MEATRPFLTIRETAALLALSTRTIHRYIAEGQLRAYRVAGEKAIRIKREDIEGLLQPVSVGETSSGAEQITPPGVGRGDPMTHLPQVEREGHFRRELPHLPKVETRALAGIVERLIEAYQPERIYLFGSKARGDHGLDSDFDLLLVVPDDAPAERQRGRLAYERLWGTGTAADVLVWTRERFDSRTCLRASLPGTILREGKLLYAV
jgi:uncharacterized protein